MGVVNEIQVELQDRLNRTIVGTLVIERNIPEPIVKPNVTKQIESDPQGASTYVVVVVLIYGLSIVFLIGSHVFIKKKEEAIETEDKKVDQYFQQSYILRDISNREAYKKLKTSIVPIVARSSAKHLISRRKSYLPILASAGVQLADLGGILSGVDQPRSSSLPELNKADVKSSLDGKGLLGVGGPSLGSRRCSFAAIQGMPSIGEEEEVEDDELPVFQSHIQNASSISLTEKLSLIAEQERFDTSDDEIVQVHNRLDAKRANFRHSRANSSFSLEDELQDCPPPHSKAQEYLRERNQQAVGVPARNNMYRLVWTSEEKGSTASINSGRSHTQGNTVDNIGAVNNIKRGNIDSSVDANVFVSEHQEHEEGSGLVWERNMRILPSNYQTSTESCDSDEVFIV